MLNLAELEKLYAEMSDEEFASIRPNDLVDAARPYYDREARRRGLPESPPQSTEIPQQGSNAEAEMLASLAPDAKRILREADGRRTSRQREIEALGNAPKSMQGPGNIGNIYRRMVVPAEDRGDNLIVWLRRFHVKRRGGLRFNQVLVAACQGFGFPLTVQDTTFRSSDAEVLPSFLPYLFVWSVWLTAMLMGLGKGSPVVMMICFLVGAILFFLMFFLGGRIGYHNLEDLSEGRAETLHVIQEIRERRGKHGDDSVLILRCQDHFWRDIVQLCLENASALVIDVTEVSENVIWELKTALNVMAPGSIILACGLAAGSVEELPGEAQVALGADGSTRVQQFFYPQLKNQIGSTRWGTKESLAEALRVRLAIAVAYSQGRLVRTSDCISQDAGGAILP